MFFVFSRTAPNDSMFTSPLTGCLVVWFLSLFGSMTVRIWEYYGTGTRRKSGALCQMVWPHCMGCRPEPSPMTAARYVTGSSQRSTIDRSTGSLKTTRFAENGQKFRVLIVWSAIKSVSMYKFGRDQIDHCLFLTIRVCLSVSVFFCLFVCMLVCLSVRLHVWLDVCLTDWLLSVCLSMWSALFACLIVCLYLLFERDLSVCLSVDSARCLSAFYWVSYAIWLPVCLSACPPACIFNLCTTTCNFLLALYYYHWEKSINDASCSFCRLMTAWRQ